MAKRTTHTMEMGPHAVKIRWNPDYKEWSAEVHPGGEKRKGDDDDYFTDDQKDAINTGKSILKQLAKKSGHEDSPIDVKEHGMKKEEVEKPFRVHGLYEAYASVYKNNRR